ncbi:uncharacterized protein LOC111310603 [Durio zibethinus]|uniref:Uncharacterized protein LOC111310603 n=1 Tax=Durio zibethinus TaxID=66656 RepID=A0A6P6ALS9_DURZI|nr:uncharacterized protein LOC111310603 [Durio zibethinus]
MVFLEGKKDMVERCLMAASLAALVCHPNATFKCFRPKSKTTTSSEREKPPREKKQPSKSTNKNEFRANSSLSRGSVSFNMNITSPPPNFPTSRSGKDPYLVSNLVEEEPSFGVVETIFRSGWDNKIGLQIEKILKINHNADVLNKFEEYRETVKSKSTNISACETERIERLAVDGNELLRFHGAVVTCPLGNDEFLNICHSECCGICRMVGSSLLEGEESVKLSNNSRQAHRKVVCVVDKICARKAIVVCRVIAGRVARCRGQGLVDGEEGGFDSVVSLSTDQFERSEELIVLNARAVLPCFIIVYNVKDSNLPVFIHMLVYISMVAVSLKLKLIAQKLESEPVPLSIRPLLSMSAFQLKTFHSCTLTH